MLKNAGFTVLELMVAVAIAGALIFMAAVSPGVDNNKMYFQNNKVQLRDALQQARNIARTKQECVAVQVNPNSLVVTSYATCSPLSNQDTTFTTQLDSTVTLTPFNVGNPLVFNQLGGTTSLASMTISAFQYSATYTVLPAIGQIQEQ